MSSVIEIKARGIVRGSAQGPALVSQEGISFLGDLDISTGVVVNKIHPLLGQSVAGTVLVIPYSVGSAGAWRFLYQLCVHNTGPVAIVQNTLPDPSLVQGAILAGVPIVCEPETDVIELINTCDHVEVDGSIGLVKITHGGLDFSGEL